ncbi:MAG: putative metal-binding motif-containing protein [Bacteroidota bacterium]
MFLFVLNPLFAARTPLSRSFIRPNHITPGLNKDSLTFKQVEYSMGSVIELVSDHININQDISIAVDQTDAYVNNPEPYIQICNSICIDVGGVTFKTRDHPNLHPNNCSICCDFPSMCPEPSAWPPFANCGTVEAYNGEYACQISPPCPTRFYRDMDSDGYGNESAAVFACSPPTGYISDFGDCNDNNNLIHPFALDVPNNGIDENCDGHDSITPFLEHLVKDVKVDTTLGLLSLTPIPNLQVKAYHNNILEEVATTNSAGKFHFTTLNINNYYTLEFHYQTVDGIPENIYSDYIYINYKPDDTIPTILIPYTALLQTRQLLNTIRDKGTYTLSYSLIDIVNTVLDTLNLNNATSPLRKVYDVAAIDTLLNDWRTIDKLEATDVITNLGRVYISMYANNQYAEDAYRLAALPSQAISELVMGVLEITKVQDKLNELASGGAPGISSPVLELAQKAAKSVVSAILQNTSYCLKLRMASLPEGMEKSEINVLLKAITVGALFLKERPEATVGIMLDLVKEIISNEGFMLLYENYLEDSQSLIAATYDKAVLLVPPDSTFQFAYDKVAKDNGTSHVYKGHDKADLAIDACNTLFNNVDKLNAVVSVTDVLSQYVSLAGNSEVQRLVSFFKTATNLFTAFKMGNYGTALYVGFSALLDNRIQQGKIPTLAFSPGIVYQNRVSSSTVSNSAGSISARSSTNQITIYNQKLDSIIYLIQNNSNQQAIEKTKELIDFSASLDKNLNTETRNIASIADKAILAIPEFDSLFISLSEDYANTTSYRNAINFNMAIWFLDTTAYTFRDTIFQLASDVKAYNLKIDKTLEIMDSITAIFQVPVRVMITGVDGEKEVKQGDTTHITVSYQNFGTDTATLCYFHLDIDSAYIISSDSLYIGDVSPGGIGQVAFDIYSPLLDTFAVYPMLLIVSNGEGDQDQNYIITKTHEICENGIDDNHNGSIDENCSLTLHLKFFLEGYYLGGDSMIAVLDPLYKPAVSDTITVELHDVINPYMLIASNTSVINTMGLGDFKFSLELKNHSYYIVVRHRNSIETWSKAPLLLDANEVLFDYIH